MHISSRVPTGTTLLNHGTINRRASASKIDVRSGGDADSDDAIKTKVLAHGTLATGEIYACT